MKLQTLVNALGATIALTLPLSATFGSSGCGQTACFAWSQSKGACPSQAQAQAFFGGCTDIQTVNGEGVSGDNLCCYPVSKLSNGINCLDVGSAGEGPSPPPTDAISVTGPSSQCDFSGFCGDSFSGCAGCATNNGCLQAFDFCLQDPACDTLRTCISTCAPTDGDCKGTCLAQNPAGQQTYGNYATCVFCKNCPSDCGPNTDLCSFETGTGGMSGTGGMTGSGGMSGTGGMTGTGGMIGTGGMGGAGGMSGAGGAGGTRTGAGGAGGTMTGAGGAGGKGG